MRSSIVSGVIIATVVLLVVPAEAFAVSDFRTPKRAAYCGVVHAGTTRLVCWTPNDGFAVSMSRYGRPKKRYIHNNRDFHDYVGEILRYGEVWRDRGFRCSSRGSGLRCSNRRGHGWRLGVFVGYRLF